MGTYCSLDTKLEAPLRACPNSAAKPEGARESPTNLACFSAEGIPSAAEKVSRPGSGGLRGR
jgi:hypothetical protein